MGFISSLTFLFVLGILAPYFAISKGKRAKNHAWTAYYSTIIVSLFLIWDLMCYCNLLNGIVPWINSLSWVSGNPFQDSRDLMINGSRLLGISSNIAISADFDKFAIILFLCYIPMYMWGKSLGMLLFGRKIYEKGLLWALKSPRPERK